MAVYSLRTEQFVTATTMVSVGFVGSGDGELLALKMKKMIVKAWIETGRNCSNGSDGLLVNGSLDRTTTATGVRRWT